MSGERFLVRPIASEYQENRGRGIGCIHIQFEIGNDEQVIPELMFKIARFFDSRVQLGHHIHDKFGCPVPFFAVLDGAAVLYHPLDIPAIFRDKHQFAGGIVFHMFVHG